MKHWQPQEAFDSLDDIKRGQYFAQDDKESTFIENLVRYGNKFQTDQQSNQISLFGGADTIEITKPAVPSNNDWQKLEKLKKKKRLSVFTCLLIH